MVWQEEDRRFVLEGIPWEAYVSIRDALGDHPVRATYLDGRLELMSPGRRHEMISKVIGRLLETYAEERGLELWGLKSTTYREGLRKRGGLEPDEGFVFGVDHSVKAVPDIALEVVTSNPLVDKLEVYAELGVPEVWVWEADKLAVHVLGAEGYALQEGSRILPELDLGQLMSYADPDAPQTSQVRAYRAALQKDRP